MKEPADVGETRPGDVINADGSLVPRWSWSWVRFHLHLKLIDVLNWFRALPFYWYGLKAGIEHGKESPGCGLAPVPKGMLRVELRGPTIGLHAGDSGKPAHWYCNVCLRPLDAPVPRGLR